MRTRLLCCVGVASSLLAPVVATGEPGGGPVRAGGDGIDARVIVALRQHQAGKSIHVRAAVTAHEPITVKGRGKVYLDGIAHPMPPKRSPVSLSASEFYAFTFQPNARIRRRVARALNHGQRPLARVRVTVADLAGNVESKAHKVRITRFHPPPGSRLAR